MKKAIHQIAAEILAEQKNAMTSDEIYDAITNRGLYEFKAQSPRSVLRSQLRRHCVNVNGVNQASKPVFNVSPDGRYTLVK